MATLVTQSERGLPNVTRLERWVVQQGLQGNTAEALFECFSAYLVAGGIQIQRGRCAMGLLHTLYQGFGLV